MIDIEQEESTAASKNVSKGKQSTPRLSGSSLKLPTVSRGQEAKDFDCYTTKLDREPVKTPLGTVDSFRFDAPSGWITVVKTGQPARFYGFAITWKGDSPTVELSSYREGKTSQAVKRAQNGTERPITTQVVADFQGIFREIKRTPRFKQAKRECGRNW